MEEILIGWIKENPAFCEDRNDSYHNRKQMMDFAKYYHSKQLIIDGVSKSFVCGICKDTGEYLNPHPDNYGWKKCNCKTN